MNSDEINLDEEFPPDNPIRSNEPASLRAPVTEQIIIPNSYPTELARKVRKQDYVDGTVARTIAALLQEIRASTSAKKLNGLSATQIGVNIQIMVAETENSQGVFELVTFVNPALTTYSRQAVEWSSNCFTPDCGNTEPGPLCLSVIALDAEARVMRLKNLVSSNEGPQIQILTHSYYGASAQRFYHQWRHLGHPALEMCVVSKAQATSELLRLTRRDNLQE